VSADLPLSTRVSPAYWQRAKRALGRRDVIMQAIIRQHPRIALKSRGDAFQTLARSIVGQQISVKAADSVWAKLGRVSPEMRPAEIARARRSRLLAAGLSGRKAEYLHDLARRFCDGSLHAARWDEMDDEAVIDDLTQVRGIGRWTAEMFLLFNLLRPDVLPVLDLGLQRAVARHYLGSDGCAEVEYIQEVAEVWRPWRSVATWYLWRSLDPLPVEY
jgi:DNA-3-methyladenine glycosylase II